jgi:multiple sugar transport system substrate-binding protein
MLDRATRSLAAGALICASLLSGATAARAHHAASLPFAGQTITVAWAGSPPPKADLARFTAQTGAKVNWVQMGWDALQTKITASATAKVYFADVTDVDWSKVGQYYLLKWFVPLNKYFDAASLKDVPQLSSFEYNGQMVGLPADTSFTVTTINMAMFKKAGITTAPTTMATYMADLKQLQAKGVSAHPLDIPLQAAEGLSTYWYQVTAAMGGTMLDKSYKPLFADPNSAGYKALAWIVDAYKSGLVPKANITMADSQGMTSEMALGRVATIFSDYSGNVGSLYNVKGQSSVIGQVQYITTPGVNGPAPNLGNPDGMGVPVTARYPDAGAAFIKWFDDAHNQALWAGLNGAKDVMVGFPLPMRLSSLQQLTKAGTVEQGDIMISLLQHHAQAAFPYGIPPWYTRFSAAVNTNIHSAALGQESVQAAVQAIAQAVNSMQ